MIHSNFSIQNGNVISTETLDISDKVQKQINAIKAKLEGIKDLNVEFDILFDEKGQPQFDFSALSELDRKALQERLSL